MAEQHTPGPWEIDSLDGCIYGQDHTCVAIPHGGAGEAIKTKPILDANARLIAAAPELLEALKALLPWVAKAQADGAFVNCVVPDGGIAAIDQAEDAIAKAEPS